MCFVRIDDALRDNEAQNSILKQQIEPQFDECAVQVPRVFVFEFDDLVWLHTNVGLPKTQS